MIARFIALALLAMTAACSAPSERMDWKALSDYLDQQEKPE
jgi:hypothetical protein